MTFIGLNPSLKVGFSFLPSLLEPVELFETENPKSTIKLLGIITP